MDLGDTGVASNATPQTRLLLVRHAHTEMAGRFCGQIDPPLSAEGRLQLAGVNERLQPYRLTQVFTSDLLRARQTAESVVDACAAPLVAVPELREISFGRWEGLTWAEITARDAEYAERWAREYPRLPAPEGEEFQIFRERITQALRHIADQSAGDCVAVVTHAGVIRTVLLELLSLPAQSLGSIACGYGSCTEILYREGMWSLSVTQSQSMPRPSKTG
jgi:alpha-ribazole phosphatase